MNQIVLSMLLKTQFTSYYRTALKSVRADESKDILRAIEVLHDSSEQDLSIDDLLLGLRTCYPEKKASSLILAVEGWRGLQYDPALVESYLSVAQKKAHAYDIALQGLEVSEGKGNYDDFVSKIKEYEIEAPGLGFDFVTHDLESLRKTQLSKGGLRWRLETLNRLLGHLPRKTFGFIFARSDSGKTTLLASEVTHMAKQMSDPVLWLANEEDASVIKIRCFQALFNVTEAQLFSDMDRYKELYNKQIGDRLMISGDPHLNNRHSIEEACKQLKPGLVIIDVLDKVGGFKAERHDLMLGGIYRWARGLANEFNVPVIGVTQANSSADGQKYLRMNHIADSHTSKAAEADWILGLGKDYDDESIRHLHTPKDKLPMSEGKVSSMRHGYADVLIKPEVARYEDLAGM